MDSFYGEFNVNLDEKGRIALPSKIRPRNEDGSSLQLILAPGMESCLALHTPENWKKFKAGLARFSYGSRDLRAYKRYVFSKVAEVTPDKQGRFLIPNNLISFAKLDEQVLIIGVDSLIEIWNPKIYSDSIAKREETGAIEDISERLANGNVGIEPRNGMSNDAQTKS